MDRSFVLAAMLALGAAWPGTASPQEYPVKPVRIIVGFPAGGGSDLIARLVAQKLSGALGQPAIVENRPGASANIAAELVAKSAPDGYTLLFGNSSVSIASAVFQKLGYDPVRDLTPISMASSYPFALAVHPSLPVRSVRELVALAKAKPDALDYASAGAGTMSQWNGLFAPVRTPQAILDRLHREMAKAVTAPDVKQRFEAEGATAVGNTPSEFAAFFRAEAAKWADVARRSGTKLD